MRAPLFATILATLVAAAACGGSEPKKAELDDWVADICDGAVTLSRAETDAYEAFIDISSDDASGVRKGFSAYVDDYTEALDRFARTSERAGQPDVDAGNKIAQAVKQWIDDEKKSLSRAERRVKDLDSDGADLVDDIDDIFFDREFTDLEELIDDTDSKDSDDVVDLIREDEECTSMLLTNP